jgi:hypothetical protein
VSDKNFKSRTSGPPFARRLCILLTLVRKVSTLLSEKFTLVRVRKPVWKALNRRPELSFECIVVNRFGVTLA